MIAPLLIFRRSYFLTGLCILLLLVAAGCRRNKTPNSTNTASNGFTAGDPEQARRQAQSLVEQGKELYKNDEDEKAAKTFEQALTQDPNNGEGHLRLGMAYAALGKKTESEEEYKKAVELFKKQTPSDSKDAGAFFFLGEAHRFLHQDDDAARAYRQAIKLKPDDEEAFYQLGMTETLLAHYPEATTAFQKALELDPDDYRATDAIENAKEGTQRIREGKKHAEDMLKKQQENANSNANSGAANTSAKPSTKRPSPRPE